MALLTADELTAFCNEDNEKDGTFLDIPEVKLCVGFLKYEITRVRKCIETPDFVKKLKLKKLEAEYLVLCRQILKLNKAMKALDLDRDDVQAQADTPAFGYELAMFCGEIIKMHALPSPRKPKHEGDENSNEEKQEQEPMEDDEQHVPAERTSEDQDILL